MPEMCVCVCGVLEWTGQFSLPTYSFPGLRIQRIPDHDKWTNDIQITEDSRDSVNFNTQEICQKYQK